MDDIMQGHYIITYHPGKHAYDVTTYSSGEYEISSIAHDLWQEKYDQEQKSRIIAFILWLLLGLIGAHRFYLNDRKMGVIMFFTLGIAGILWVLDFFSLLHKVTSYNENLERRLLIETIQSEQKTKSAKNGKEKAS